MTQANKTTKVCRGCGRELPLVDFYDSPKAKDGHRNYCKHCHVERQSQHYANDPAHKVKHRTELHLQQPKPKARKKRVANGKGDRSEYMKKYYQDQKVRLTEKNHADYIRRKLETDAPASPLGKRKPLKVGRTCLQCVNYPCFDGIENLESDFAKEGCHAFRKREENDGNN